MTNTTHFRKLENMYKNAPTNAHFLPTVHIEEGVAEVSIMIRPAFFHAAGATHGAYYFKVLDDATFFAANSVETEFFMVTVSMSMYLLRPITEGTMRAVAKVVHRSKRLIVAEGEIIGRGSGSFMPSGTPLSPAMHYTLPDEQS